MNKKTQNKLFTENCYPGAMQKNNMAAFFFPFCLTLCLAWEEQNPAMVMLNKIKTLIEENIAPDLHPQSERNTFCFNLRRM